MVIRTAKDHPPAPAAARLPSVDKVLNFAGVAPLLGEYAHALVVEDVRELVLQAFDPGAGEQP